MNNIMILLKTDNYSDVPRLLLDKITSDEAGDFLEQFTQKDQGNDALRDFFQERYAARKDLKQDYTPDCLGKLINKLTGDSAKVLDMCAGTGALTIHGSQSREPDIERVLEEMADVYVTMEHVKSIFHTFF